MEEIDNSRGVVRQLTRIYNKFNEYFWNRELPEVIITFSPVKGGRGYMSESPWWVSDIEGRKYELNISAFSINRPAIEIAEVILHEQCHLFNILNDIKDCSNYGRYHNRKFKVTAENHGLVCQHVEVFGWANTSLTDDAVKFFNSLRIKKFAYSYQRPKGIRKLQRYICPNGHATAWVSSPQFLICGMCHRTLINKEVEDTSCNLD